MKDHKKEILGLRRIKEKLKGVYQITKFIWI